jgi:protease I
MADATVLTGKKIALLATDGFEDSELTEPLDALKSAGAEVTVISDQADKITGKNGAEVLVDKTVEGCAAEDFDGLLLPGGVQNPDKLRMVEPAVNFVRDFFVLHKPVAAICHAPWMLAEAGVLEGRTVTSWPSLKTDLENAGANWVDEEVVVDNGLVTSRKPDDLEAFCAKAVEEFAEGEHADQTA